MEKKAFSLGFGSVYSARHCLMKHIERWKERFDNVDSKGILLVDFI